MKKFAVIAIVIVIAISGGWFYLKQTPQYSLYKFGQALKEHDSETAFQYIDIDAVVDNMMRNVVQEMETTQVSSSNPWEQMGNNFAKGLVTLMLPTLKEAARNEIRASIQEPSKSGGKASFNVFAGTASWREFDIERQGKIAVVTKRTDKDFQVKLAQVKDGHWKIVQLISKDFKPSVRE